MKRHTLLFVLAAGLALPLWAQEADTLVMPDFVGQALYPAARTLRGMGLEISYAQVAADSSDSARFRVAGQDPAAGTALEAGQAVTLQFNCVGELRYWGEWAVRMLGDFENTAGFYSVEKPPEPVRFVGAGYPAELRKYDFSGDALVEALVDFDGSVLAAWVRESSGYPAADSAALDAALQASFSPASHYGEPKRVWFPLPFHWEFDEGPQLPSTDPANSDGRPIEP
ncbi:TonB family protein [candidate division WOR-3 bacterium]|nr:TonB family protein [candidate division WOR-3 bacterium]